MQLVRPGSEHLASYVEALGRGWSAYSERGVEAAREELSCIYADFGNVSHFWTKRSSVRFVWLR